MSCNCFAEIDKINENNGLDFKGLRQSTALNIANGKSAFITLLVIDYVKRGTNRKTNQVSILSYCPFCGEPQTQEGLK